MSYISIKSLPKKKKKTGCDWGFQRNGWAMKDMPGKCNS